MFSKALDVLYKFYGRIEHFFTFKFVSGLYLKELFQRYFLRKKRLFKVFFLEKFALLKVYCTFARGSGWFDVCLFSIDELDADAAGFNIVDLVVHVLGLYVVSGYVDNCFGIIFHTLNQFIIGRTAAFVSLVEDAFFY